MKKLLQIAGIALVMTLLRPLAAKAQPGMGFVLVHVVDVRNMTIHPGTMTWRVVPINPFRPLEERWINVARDSISDEWLRLPSHVLAMRLRRENETMEVWFDNIAPNLEIDLFIDSLHWNPGSFTLFAKEIRTDVQIPLAGKTSTLAAQYVSEMELAPRRQLPIHP